MFNDKVTIAPTVSSSASLSTTPAKATLASGALSQQLNVRISNLSASNLLAWTIVTTGAAAPTVNATLGHASCGAVVGPGQVQEIVLSNLHDLYVVGSASSTSYVVVSTKN
jgi:hypothetical protein